MINVGNKDVAEYYAILLMAMLIGLNIITLSALVYIIAGQKVDIAFNSTSIMLIEYLLLSSFLYLLFVRKGKHVEIARSYEGESRKQEMIGKLFAIGYIILSIGLMIFAFYAMMKKNRGEL